MEQFLHGAYAQSQILSSQETAGSETVAVYVGLAPIHLAASPAAINTPVLVRSWEQAVKAFGYSEDWAVYTLCEPIWEHFRNRGVGPIVLINLFDPGAAGVVSQATKEAAPVAGRVTIAEASDAVLSSVQVTVGDENKTESVAISYDPLTEVLTLRETEKGALGTAQVTVTYNAVNKGNIAITAADIAGTDDGEGATTGVKAINKVYQLTGAIPNLLMCPGFSDQKVVHDAMLEVTEDINGHWDAVVYADLPLMRDEENRMTLSTAAAWKTANGYDADDEKVFFPMWRGDDGRKYHLSVKAAAVRQQLDSEAGGIPYRSPSNQPIMGEGLYLGEGVEGVIYDEPLINRTLNAHGITSAAYVSGRWVIWGPTAAAYEDEDAEDVKRASVADTIRAMLYYIVNDFQLRRGAEVDQPMTVNRMQQIVAEEQARLDALVTSGMLIYGKAQAVTGEDARMDMMMGDYKFIFTINTTPLAKSLTAYVYKTDDGLGAYYV